MSGFARHLPNILTGLRLASAPVVALLLFGGRDGAALSVFAFAGLSDAADGFLAKRFGFATSFGRYLDPAADKILMLASFVTLTLLGKTPVWLTAVVIGRDLSIVVGVAIAVALTLPVRVEPLFVGKVSTAFQIAYVALALVLLSAGLDWPRILGVATLVTAAVTVLSWLGYARLLIVALMARGRA